MQIDLNDETLNLGAMFDELMSHNFGTGTTYLAVIAKAAPQEGEGVSRIRCFCNIEPNAAMALMIDSLARMHQRALAAGVPPAIKVAAEGELAAGTP